MHHRLSHFHAHTGAWHYLWSEAFIALLLVLLVLVASPVAAADKRLQQRSLYILDNEPSITTSYTLSFQYMSPEAVGSVEMLFCYDPIPYHACVAPAGLDVSGATLSEQLGETGYTIGSQSANRIVLSRSPDAPLSLVSSYTFDNIVNPSDTSQAFAIRLKTLGSTDGTGAQIDFGSVRGQVATGIKITTQVPPMLIFCLAEEVEYLCTDTNENYFTDMGELTTSTTATAQSQMAVGTNASAGFVITANGAPPAAGTNVIAPMAVAGESVPGTNQFGINLVANTAPAVGIDPEGEWANAVASVDYGTPNFYKYTSGDTVAYSPNVSLMKKFTVSYILNAGDELEPGVYSTTITFIASGRF